MTAKPAYRKSAAQKAQDAARDRLPIRAGIQPDVPVTGDVVDLYSDGACDTTKGHGGWATILDYKGKELVLSGHEEGTTNNRMELRGLLDSALALLTMTPQTDDAVQTVFRLVERIQRARVQYGEFHPYAEGGAEVHLSLVESRLALLEQSVV